MALRFDIGDTFPDMTRTDDRGNAVSIRELANGQPLFLAFFMLPIPAAADDVSERLRMSLSARPVMSITGKSMRSLAR